ncbi:hypothetical protein KP509_21G053900 [Ceratopteris richardii]|uniref:Peptidase A2 domain-containing protein n=1 Tax=Ceratopteris richardii TaxID=49495 RepID=A0A8T2SC39_CERRI|nr:hypothetical protein KP509_21G053900 [Ceratopteris richardii]
MAMCQTSSAIASQIIDRRPFVNIAIGQGKNARTVRALIDSGAATSVVRLSYCKDLQLNIKPIEAYLIGLGGVETPCLGEVELPIYLQAVPIKVKMLVCHDEDLTEPLILGQDWIYDHAINLNLRSHLLQVWIQEQCITLELDNCMLTNPEVTHSLSSSGTNFRNENVVCVNNPTKQKDSIVEAKAQRPVNLSSSSHTNACVTRPQRQAKMTSAISTRLMEFKKKEAQGMKQIWVRKGKQPPALPQPFPVRQINYAKRSTKKRGPAQSYGLRQIWVPKQSREADHNNVQIWVRKKLVAAQKGRLQMWVPKTLLHPQPPQISLTSKASTKTPRRSKVQHQEPRTKADQPTSSTIIKRQPKRVWVWKTKVPLASREPKSQQRWIPKFSNHPKIQRTELMSIGTNTTLKWIPIRRLTSLQDSINPSKQRWHQVHT